MRLTLGLVLVLVGCATPPTVRGTPWQFHDGAVDVDFEQPPAQQAEQLRQRGVHLPRGPHGLADLRAHRDFAERRVTAVGFGLSAGGYLLYCEGVALPVLVPESPVDLGLTGAAALNTFLYPDRATAPGLIHSQGLRSAEGERDRALVLEESRLGAHRPILSRILIAPLECRGREARRHPTCPVP